MFMEPLISYKSIVFFTCLVLLVGCSTVGDSGGNVDLNYLSLAKRPLPPEESKELLADLGKNWLYGNGLGGTALNVGMIVTFPPYAIYVVGNACLSMAGYKEIGLGSVLPDRGREAWEDLYDGVTSGPGRFTSAIAGEEYRSRELARIKLDRYLRLTEAQN